MQITLPASRARIQWTNSCVNMEWLRYSVVMKLFAAAMKTSNTQSCPCHAPRTHLQSPRWMTWKQSWKSILTKSDQAPGTWSDAAPPTFTRLATVSLIFLHCAFWTMLVAVLTGVNDVGLDLGAGNRIILGFLDRWENAFRAESSVTIHVWLALMLIGLTLARLLWRLFGRSHVLAGVSGALFGLLTLLSFWTLLAATYVGASVSHK